MNMRVFINRSPILNSPWGGGNAWLKALHDFSTENDAEIVSDPKQADVIVLFALVVLALLFSYLEQIALPLSDLFNYSLRNQAVSYLSH